MVSVGSCLGNCEGLHCNENCKEFNHMQLIDLYSIMFLLAVAVLSNTS